MRSKKNSIIELFKQGRKVSPKTKDGKSISYKGKTEFEVGSFVKLKGENFYRRVNSDGTLTKVEDGLNGTYDFRKTPKKVKELTSWRLALANTIDPTRGYPSEILEGISLRNLVKSRLKVGKETELGYTTPANLGDSVANAAWRKYLGLSYDSKLLPKGVKDDRTSYKENTVRLPRRLELEIPVDTAFIKQRIENNKKYLYNSNPKSDEAIKVLKAAIEIDTLALDALRKTYATGQPVGMHENSYNSRQLINDGEVNYSSTPLNVLLSYNIRYDKNTNRMYYSDEYGFDNSNPWPISWLGGYDKYLDGDPFRFRGYIDLNK